MFCVKSQPCIFQNREIKTTPYIACSESDGYWLREFNRTTFYTKVGGQSFVKSIGMVQKMVGWLSRGV